MKRIITYIILGLSLVSCAKWNETEAVQLRPVHFWDRNPELWADYMEALRDYRQTEHFIYYARFDNAPEIAVNEQSSLRSLPDSLDIVSLTNADNFCAADREDMTVMHDKGIKVLYQIDLAGRQEEFSDDAVLDSYLDATIAKVKEYGLDGWSFTTVRGTDPAVSGKHARIIEKLSQARKEGQLIVSEGDPHFIPAADLEKLDYLVLPTDQLENTYDVRLCTMEATALNIPADKILLAASVDGILADEDKVEHNAVTEMNLRVVSFGPFAGLAVYDLAHDYYHQSGNYLTLRYAIQTLNPSK